MTDNPHAGLLSHRIDPDDLLRLDGIASGHARHGRTFEDAYSTLEFGTSREAARAWWSYLVWSYTPPEARR